MQPFYLSNFKGSLDLLILLIQKQELDIFDIMIKEITDQFLKKAANEKIEVKAEFLPLASSLLVIKSRKLLPSTGTKEEVEEEVQLRLDLLNQLLEYSQFKDFAEKLLKKEEEESAYFSRKVPQIEKEAKPKLEEIAIENLASILEELIKKNVKKTHVILSEKEWDIEPKMLFLKEKIKKEKSFDFYEVFSSDKTRIELILLFLALLELLKDQTLKIEKIEDKLWILEKT